VHLKRINIKGFKSFADRVDMTFEPGVAVIVGPNGSGKSNIVDALMWVMSTAPPSGLRAETHQDVLFLGTQDRPPAGVCEVEIVLDNADGGMKSVPYSEISIKRRLEREGESQYLINGNQVRRLDIMELLADTGIGKDMHSVIGQGKIDRLLAAKPADRRAAIEEAAGLGKYKRRRKRAQQKLDRVRLDIARVRDIERELESRLRPLKTQANAAQRYNTVLAERWTMQLVLDKDSLRRAGDELNRANERRDAARKAVFATEKVATDLRAERDKVDRDTAQTMQQAEVARTLLQRIGGVTERLRVRHASLEDRAASMRRFAAASRVRREQGHAELDRGQRELAGVRDRLTEVRARVEVLQQEQQQLAQQITGYEQLFTDERECGRRIAELEGTVAVLVERGQSLATRLETLEREYAAISEQQREVERKLRDHGKLVAQAERLVSERTSARDQLVAAHAQTDERAEATRVAHDAARTAQARAEERLAVASTRVESLDERIAAASANTAAVHDGPTLAEAFEVQSGYERALAAALAGDAEAVVAANRDELVQVAMRASGHDVRAFVPQAGEGRRSVSTLAGGMPLTQVARLRSGFDSALTDKLVGILVVDDLAAASQQLNAHGQQGLLVTRDGVALDLAGLRAWTVGSGGAAQLMQLRNQRETAGKELEAATEARTTSQRELERSEAALNAVVQEAATARQRAAQSEADLGAAQSELASTVASGQSLARENDDLVARLERTQRERTAASDERERWRHDDTTARERLQQETETHARLLDEVEAARREETVARETAAARSAEFAGLSSEMQGLERDERRLAAQAEQLTREGAEAARDATRFEAYERIAMRAAVAVRVALDALADTGDLAERAAAGERQLAKIDKIRRDLSEREQHALAEVASARNELTTTEVLSAQVIERMQVAQSSVEETLRRYREHVEEARELLEKVRAEAAASATDEPDVPAVETDGASEGAEDGDPFGGVEIELRDIDSNDPVELEPSERDALITQVAKLARKLDLMGPINPLAAREYDEQAVRHTDVVEQRKDLEAAARELELLIDDLDTTLAARFNETFEAVSQHFEQAVSALFPGGSGQLKLVQPPRAVNEDGDEDPDAELPDPGVEIVVKPAGKPAGRLGLLSGGEKSLVALAFLFSLFLANPSPFYVLDEVEAALDDANIVRFLALLQQYRDRAQFLVITHQVRTMEAADVLYGVTMHAGTGVSSVVARRPVGKRSAVFTQERLVEATDDTDREPEPAGV
jgi:chromosome segregation protein